MVRACCRFLGRQLRFKRLLVLALVGWMVGLYLYAAHLADGQLQEAIAEADALDPSWKLDEWRWGTLPGNEKDAGLAALFAASAKLPAEWPSRSFQLLDCLRPVSPAERLQEPALVRLREELDQAADALLEARKLADRPPAALRISWENPWNANLEPIQKIRLVCQLLNHDAMYRAQRGDAAGALASCRAALHACQAIDSTSLAIGFLVRGAGCDLALRAIETTLAGNQAADAQLAAMQQSLEVEQRAPALTNALRGERASLHWGLAAMESGETPMSRSNYVASETNALPLPPVAGAYDRLGIPMVRYVHAWLLRYYARLLEISRLPCAQQNQQLVQLRISLTPQWYTVPPAANMLIFSGQLFIPSQRSQARLRSMIVALAVERHRERTGAWPETLAAIAPRPWPEAWTDPYDGEPLRYRRLADGVAIYTVGPDQLDNQGKFDRNNSTVPGTDIGVRLWDVERRGTPK